jgi:hypothetical protein
MCSVFYCYMCSVLHILFSSCQLALFSYPDWGFFPCFFLSCKANARVKLAKTGHGPHSFQINCVVVCIVCVKICIALLPPGVNSIAVNKMCLSISTSRRTGNWRHTDGSTGCPIYIYIYSFSLTCVDIKGEDTNN